ncbi:MAG: ADP-ribosylglycohydrolase family protein, partial [Clostridiales bacterium]|nr:ADP-ribosylglycohydrolase family protein [Clostridiales bacterium]
MIISLNDYRKKVLGCWMGKNIGGTLGAPMEWKRQVNNVTFYTQELGGNPLPNDDLDLQLVWLVALEEKGIDIDARTLGEYWLLYITPHWAEYGNSKINMRSGLVPPISGIRNNPHKDSCGAFIRSEIWACIAPGCPEVATKYAYEDAIVDHGNGEGLYAEVFCTALESAAFVEDNVYKLIEIGLSYIPEDCGVSKVVKLVIDAYKSGKPYLEVRDEILAKYRAQFWEYAGISQEDRDKGFADGPVGWDAPANIGFLIIGLLYGEGDFGRSLCITVNCGEDTDCTGATLGSIFGIIHGIDAIPQKWVEPIGRNIKTMCLNLGELYGQQLPANIDKLTERVEKIAKQVVLRYCPLIDLSENKATDLSDLNDKHLFTQSSGKSIYRNLNGTIYKFNSFDIMVDYIEGSYVKDNTPKKIRFKILNTSKTPE